MTAIQRTGTGKESTNQQVNELGMIESSTKDSNNWVRKEFEKSSS